MIWTEEMISDLERAAAEAEGRLAAADSLEAVAAVEREVLGRRSVLAEA